MLDRTGKILKGGKPVSLRKVTRVSGLCEEAQIRQAELFHQPCLFFNPLPMAVGESRDDENEEQHEPQQAGGKNEIEIGFSQELSSRQYRQKEPGCGSRCSQGFSTGFLSDFGTGCDFFELSCGPGEAG